LRAVIRASNKEELIRRIEETLNEDVTEVYINMRPTKEIVVTILDNAPNVRRISCPPSLYPKVSKRIVRTLKAMNIELIPEKTKRGRPRKYSEATMREVIDLIRKGKKPREISAQMHIPLRTVYYFINNTNMNVGLKTGGKKVRQA